MNRFKLAAAIALSLAGVSQVASAAGPRPAAAPAAATALPAALKAAAIATRSDAHGQIAGAQIGRSDFYIVYIRTQNGCGTGGCRAQIWKRQGASFAMQNTISVGLLPIVVLPQVDNGMPRLGVTVKASTAARGVLPMAFNGRTYPGDWSDNLLPAGSGRPLLTDAMLRPF